jgi:hypothetical protein
MRRSTDPRQHLPHRPPRRPRLRPPLQQLLPPQQLLLAHHRPDLQGSTHLARRPRQGSLPRGPRHQAVQAGIPRPCRPAECHWRASTLMRHPSRSALRAPIRLLSLNAGALPWEPARRRTLARRARPLRRQQLQRLRHLLAIRQPRWRSATGPGISRTHKPTMATISTTITTMVTTRMVSTSITTRSINDMEPGALGLGSLVVGVVVTVGAITTMRAIARALRASTYRCEECSRYRCTAASRPTGPPQLRRPWRPRLPQRLPQRRLRPPRRHRRQLVAAAVPEQVVDMCGEQACRQTCPAPTKVSTNSTDPTITSDTSSLTPTVTATWPTMETGRLQLGCQPRLPTHRWYLPLHRRHHRRRPPPLRLAIQVLRPRASPYPSHPESLAAPRHLWAATPPWVSPRVRLESLSISTVCILILLLLIVFCTLTRFVPVSICRHLDAASAYIPVPTPLPPFPGSSVDASSSALILPHCSALSPSHDHFLFLSVSIYIYKWLDATPNTRLLVTLIMCSILQSMCSCRGTEIA